MQNRCLLLILFFVISPFALSATLLIKLPEDLPQQISHNIYAHLGTLPTEKRQRSAFIFSAKKKTLNALNALGYYGAKVTNSISKDVDKDSWTLTIAIVLNKPTLINKLQIVINGDATHDPEFSALVKENPIHKGDVLDHGIYEKFKESLLYLGLERGYFDSKFTKSNILIHKNLQTADIILHFDSGLRYQFGDIKFNAVDINFDVLKPLIPFNKGQFYQQKFLQDLQNGLDETQYFSNVVVRPETENMIQNILPIDISLEKNKLHQIDIGLGYATDTKENFSLGWKTPLVNRYGHRQETRLSYSAVNPTGSFIYSVPLSHPNNDLLQLKTLLEKDEFADLTSRMLSLQIGRIYFESEMLRQPYIKYLNEQWHIDNTYDNASYAILGFTWSDKAWQGSALDPSSGFRQYYNVEGSHEKVNSASSFLRFNARWKYIALLAPKHRFVTRAEVGYALVKNDVDMPLSPSLLFYAGGDQSVRGFAYQSVGPKITVTESNGEQTDIVIGGTNMAIASLEYQYYFSNKWRGALFVDGGSVNNIDKLDLIYSVGTGIHYISPIGAIRFAVGFPLKGDDSAWRVHFSIGADL